MANIGELLFDALALSCIYALVALGINLIYGLTRIVNFAQGQLIILGGFLGYVLQRAGLPFALVAVVAAVAAGLVGVITYVTGFRRTLESPLAGFIVSLGLITASEGAFVLIWGTNSYSVSAPFSGAWKLAGIIFDQPRILLIAVSILVGLCLFVFLDHTDHGRGVRAMAEEKTAALVLGVPGGNLTIWMFFVGSALAGLAGVLLATVFPFTAYSGSAFLLAGFAIAIIGGLGSVRGAVLASVVLALATTLGAGYISANWSDDFGVIAMVAILLWRPLGLFPGTEGTGRGRLSLRLESTDGQRPERGAITATKWALGVGLLAVAPLLLGPSDLATATSAVVLAVVGFSLWFPFRYAGLFSIVQGALMGTGAYMAGVLASHLHASFWVVLPASVAGGAIVAGIMGLLALRTTASYFLIFTFALAELLDDVFTNWGGLTGGSLGMTQGSPPSGFFGIQFSSASSFYYLCLAVLLLVVGVSVVLGRSTFGRRLIAIRDNERLASSLGLNTFLQKLVAFSIGGAFGGAGGCCYLYDQKYIQPGLFNVFAGTSIALIVIIGGAGSVAGPVVGSFLIAFLPDILNLSPDATEVAEGLLLIVAILLFKQGLMGALSTGMRQLNRLAQKENGRIQSGHPQLPSSTLGG